MRQAAANLAARRNRDYQFGGRGSIRVSTPSPISGWNTRDGANEIGPEECYDVENLVPDVGGLVLRPGYQSYFEASNPLQSMHVWASGTQESLLAAQSDYLFAVDGSGGVGGLLSGDWFSTMMNDQLGLVNGYDLPRKYDGTNFSLMTISGPAEPNRLIGVKNHKSRSYFWNQEQLGFWYSQPNALGGVLTYFPLTTVAQRGGRVMSCNTWTRDGGAGPDDYFVVTTSKGEVIVYAGSNPSDANDWALVGRFFIAEPISQKGFLELDGKLWVLTKTDLEILPDRFLRQSTKPSKLSGAIRDAYDRGRSFSHWGIVFDPVRQWVLVNVPTGDETAEQYVVAPRGMTKFTRMNATCWVSYRGTLFWCGRGRDANYLSYGPGLLTHTVSQADWIQYSTASLTTTPHIWRMTGTRDNDDYIYYSARTGYSPLRTGQEKRITAYRPLMVGRGNLLVQSAIAYDYSDRYQGSQSVEETSETTDAPWGADWGTEWAVENRSRDQWFVGHGTGQTASLQVSGLTVNGFQWGQTDWEYIPGGGY